MRNGRARGFTLLEAVLALSLITTICVGGATLFTTSARAAARSRAATIGSLLAREKMEQLRALPFDDPALAAFGVDTLREDFDGYGDAPMSGFRRRWSVMPLPGYSTSGVVVEVAVFADDGRLVARLVAIRARKAV